MTAQLQYRRNDNDQTNVFPSARRHEHGLEPCRAGHAEHRAQADPAQRHRQLLAHAVVGLNHYAFVNDVTGDAGIAGVSHRSVRLGRAAALVLEPLEPARRHAVAAHGLAPDASGYGWTHPSTEAHAPGRRRLAPRQHASARPTANAERRVRLHRAVRVRRRPTIHGGGLDFADFLLGLPQQAALQYGPGNEQAARQVDEPVSAGRLAQERQPDVQSRRPLRAALAVTSRATARWSTST